MLNKDITHPQMRRRIEKPRVILLDCPLEYKKLESAGGYEFTKDDQFAEALKVEEEYIANICRDIINFKPDLVITEKGLSDLAQHYFVKNNITALRRVKKTDCIRIAKATGATIVSRTEEIQECDVGVGGLFEIRKLGDDYFTFIEDCPHAKACTVLLRGANKDVLNEIERNLHDAMHVARNVVLDPRLVPGGGASEMSVSQALTTKSNSIEGVQQWTYRGIASALEAIPRTLAQNCGAKVVKLLTELRAKHASDPVANSSWGIDGSKGTLVDMKTLGVWEPIQVKAQTFKTAIEAGCLLLRVDDIVSGMSKKKDRGGGAEAQPPPEAAEEME